MYVNTINNSRDSFSTKRTESKMFYCPSVLVYNEIATPESLHTETALLSRANINHLAQELKGKHLKITTVEVLV